MPQNAQARLALNVRLMLTFAGLRHFIWAFGVTVEDEQQDPDWALVVGGQPVLSWDLLAAEERRLPR